MSIKSEQEPIVVGQLAGVFGVKGWLKVRSFTQPEDNILTYLPWRIKTAKGLQEMEVDAFQVRPQGLVIHFKGLDDRDLAAAYGRAEIIVDKSLLPELPQGEFYWHELIGLKVISSFNGGSSLLGILSEMLETGANDVIVVKPCDGSIDDQDRLIPYILDQYVLKVDMENKCLVVDWDPEF